MPDTLTARLARLAPAARIALAAVALSGCGGGNPLGTPPEIVNGAGTGAGKLLFAYFQKCIDPILQAELDVNLGGTITRNSCAGSGCHDTVAGTGGALRLVPRAAALDLADPAITPEVIRASDIYKNFYSAQGEVVPGSPSQSRLVNKPLVRGVLHGGGLIFDGDDDPNVRRLAFWINRPAPAGQDEFSAAAASMFDPVTGECLSE